MSSTMASKDRTSYGNDPLDHVVATRRKSLSSVPHSHGALHSCIENSEARGLLVASIKNLARQVPLWVLKSLVEESSSFTSAGVRRRRPSKLFELSKSVEVEEDNCSHSSVSNISEGWPGDDQWMSIKNRELKTGAQENEICMVDVTSFENVGTLDNAGNQRDRVGANHGASFMLVNRGDTGDSSHKFDNEPNLPYTSSHQCAMLFVDISGFTKLATQLDTESFSKAINEYFHLIVGEISSHGGDVLKFAGDAVFAKWSVSLSDHVENSLRTVEDCVTVAAICGAKVVAVCSDYPVLKNTVAGMSTPRSQVALLNIRCGIGTGKLFALQVGNDLRREHLVLGEPVNQAVEAQCCAVHGEVVASIESLVLLSRSSALTESLAQSLREKEPGVIATRGTALFTPTASFRFQCANQTGADVLNAEVARQIEWMDNRRLESYLQLLSLYVHPVSVEKERLLVNSLAQARTWEDAELRNVCVLFIKPMVPIKVTDDEEKNSILFALLNDILKVTVRELDRFLGHLRQYIVDDKGLVLIATFGLRGCTFPNMVGNRALPVANIIHNAIREELGVENRIGITIGKVYCGIVGSKTRHEYAAIGPSVNLAARLMASTVNPGILVDDKVRSLAGREYTFAVLPSVHAKGYTYPIPIFEPLDAITRGLARVPSNFTGREKELIILGKLGEELWNAPNVKSKIVFLSGQNGTGKTTLVFRAIDQIRKEAIFSRKRMMLTTHMSKSGDAAMPFSAFRSIMVDALKNVSSTSSMGKSDNSFCGSSSAFMSNATRKDGCSIVSSETCETKGEIVETFDGICSELNAPKEFVELVGNHLLRLNPTQISGLNSRLASRGGTCAVQDLVTLMTLTFERCTRDADVTIVALDDAHLTDKMSWEVLRRLFETVPNILIICTSRERSITSRAVNKEFWTILQSTHIVDRRFIPIRIGLLSENDVNSMIVRTLGKQPGKEGDRLLHAVYTQSGGIPQYANEIIQSVARYLDIGRRSSLYMFRETAQYASLGDILLHRLDSFDATVRNALNLGAVLGESFTLIDVSEILFRFHDSKGTDFSLHATVHEALSIAVKEGVLFVEYTGGGKDTFDEPNQESTTPSPDLAFSEGNLQYVDVCYTFSHKGWRSSILQVMLDSRIRDTHRMIALTLESRQGTEPTDFLSKAKLFNHWRACGNFPKTAFVALLAWKDFVNLGLYDDSIQVLRDAIGMWSFPSSFEENDEDSCPSMFDILSVEDVEWLIKLYIALGKSLATIYDVSGSVQAYHAALKVLKESKASLDLKDRSVGFPIFSGLYISLKFGHIKQDDECTYERTLVARFVEETNLNGDPVHFARALAMQGEMYARLGDFSKALAAHSRLAEVYVAAEHHALMCQSYGSDRGAQSFGCSAVWLVILGRTEEAMQTCRYVIDELMPHMDLQNVHNAFVMLYPVIFILKDNGLELAAEGRALYEKYFGLPFEKYYGNRGHTFSLPIYKPIMICFNLFIKQNADIPEFDEYLKWALEEENLRLGLVLNNATACYGRMADAICAESCLLLAKRLDRGRDKEKLIRVALVLVSETKALATKANAIASLRQIAHMKMELEELADELGIDIDNQCE